MRISDWSSDVCSSDLQMFYICAIDTRVRSTYSIAQLCLSLRENISLFSEEQQDLVAHVIMDQSLAILRAMRSREGERFGRRDSVEVRSEGCRVGKECVSTCR